MIVDVVPYLGLRSDGVDVCVSKRTWVRTFGLFGGEVQRVSNTTCGEMFYRENEREISR